MDLLREHWLQRRTALQEALDAVTAPGITLSATDKHGNREDVTLEGIEQIKSRIAELDDLLGKERRSRDG